MRTCASADGAEDCDGDLRGWFSMVSQAQDLVGGEGQTHFVLGIELCGIGVVIGQPRSEVRERR